MLTAVLHVADGKYLANPGANNVTLAELEAELAADFEEEPSWELPAELQSYR